MTAIQQIRLKGSTNLEFLIQKFDFLKSELQIKQGFVLEGGSGSGKTFDIINFLLLYCQHYQDLGKDILIFRDTLADLKKSVYKDFKKILQMYGLYESFNDFLSPPIHYNLFGNTIYFSGLDLIQLLTTFLSSPDRNCKYFLTNSFTRENRSGKNQTQLIAHQ